MASFMNPKQAEAIQWMQDAFARTLGFPPQKLRHVDKLIIPERRAVKVLCMGLPRTGTFSMFHALQSLGYRPYHMLRIFEHPTRDAPAWTEAVNAKALGKGKPFGKEEFDKLFYESDAILDMPTVFFEELLDIYPDAKVILTHRPIEAWMRSCANTIGLTTKWKSWPYVAWADPILTGPWIRLSLACEQLMPFGKSYGSAEQQAELARQYEQHYEKIRSRTPKERLLEFHTGKTGMQELCDFLEIPQERRPEGEYPKVNDSSMFVTMFAMIWWRSVRMALTKVVGGGILAGGLAWIMYVQRHGFVRIGKRMLQGIMGA